MVADFDWTTATVIFLASSPGCGPAHCTRASRDDQQQDERLDP